MRLHHANFIAVFGFLSSASSEFIDYSGYKVFTITHEKVNQKYVNYLQAEFNADVWDSKKGQADIMVSPDHLEIFQERLNLHGLHNFYHQKIEDVGGLIEKPRKNQILKDLSDFNYEIYHSYEEINNWVDLIAEQYSDIVEIESLGFSHEGREMRALKVVSGKNLATKSYYFEATIHAREWITPAALMQIVSRFLENYKNGEQNEVELLENLDWYFLPVTNPDGYVYSWEHDRMWRKTRSLYDESGRCYGVDANRNWDTKFWDDDIGSTSYYCSELYRGPNPWSEPCVVNVRDYITKINADRNPVKGFFDIHSYSQFWLYNFGYDEHKPDNLNNLAKIGNFAAGAIYDVHGTVFDVGDWYNVLYPSAGTAIDYMYDVQKVPCATTTELRDTGRYGFLLPEDQITPVSEEMYAAYMLVGNAVVDGYCNSQSSDTVDVDSGIPHDVLRKFREQFAQ